MYLKRSLKRSRRKSLKRSRRKSLKRRSRQKSLKRSRQKSLKSYSPGIIIGTGITLYLLFLIGISGSIYYDKKYKEIILDFIKKTPKNLNNINIEKIAKCFRNPNFPKKIVPKNSFTDGDFYNIFKADYPRLQSNMYYFNDKNFVEKEYFSASFLYKILAFYNLGSYSYNIKYPNDQEKNFENGSTNLENLINYVRNSNIKTKYIFFTLTQTFFGNIYTSIASCLGSGMDSEFMLKQHFTTKRNYKFYEEKINIEIPFQIIRNKDPYNILYTIYICLEYNITNNIIKYYYKLI